MDQVGSTLAGGAVGSRLPRTERGPLEARDGLGSVEAKRERSDADVRDRFVEIYRELFPSLYGFVRFRVGDAHAAEDLVGQVFERALGRLAGVRQPERVRAWLFTIARNAIVDYRRRQRSAVGLEQAVCDEGNAPPELRGRRHVMAIDKASYLPLRVEDYGRDGKLDFKYEVTELDYDVKIPESVFTDVPPPGTVITHEGTVPRITLVEPEERRLEPEP